MVLSQSDAKMSLSSVKFPIGTILSVSSRNILESFKNGIGFVVGIYVMVEMEVQI
jgi:hypothetical protein